jgi:multisubunit Na+/H+ antiporter MnhF subunit
VKLVVTICLGLLVIAGALGVARIVRRSSLGDRAIAFDMLTSVLTCSLLVSAGYLLDGLLLDLAIILGLLGFIASVTIARFIEARDGSES